MNSKSFLSKRYLCVCQDYELDSGTELSILKILCKYISSRVKRFTVKELKTINFILLYTNIFLSIILKVLEI
jgi:hypothetical protein